MFAVFACHFVEGWVASLGQDNGIGCPDGIKVIGTGLSPGAE
jgi:hypothetical protein